MTQSATTKSCSLLKPIGKGQPREGKGRDFPKPLGGTGQELRLESRHCLPVPVAKDPQAHAMGNHDLLVQRVLERTSRGIWALAGAFGAV